MKAAFNGVRSLSVQDGWWVERCLESFAGWSIHKSGNPDSDGSAEARSLYDKLENTFPPLYCDHAIGYAEVMLCAIAINGSCFNTQGVVTQNKVNAYSSELEVQSCYCARADGHFTQFDHYWVKFHSGAKSLAL